MRRASALVALAALAASGCSDPGTTASHRTGPGRVGGALVVGVTTIGSTDPATAYDPAGDQVQSLVCEPLVTRDPRSGALARTGLATYWITTSKGSQLTVRLRKGLRFSDGSKVNVNDVVASWSRAALVETASPSAEVLAPVKGFDTVHGEVDSDNATELSRLHGLTALSDTSLSVSLQGRNAAFVERLSEPVTAVTPRGTTGSSSPRCVGPYVQHPAGGAVVTLTRNSSYYNGNSSYDDGGRGYADSVTFRVLPTRADAATAFRSGKVDIAPLPDAELGRPLPAGTTRIDAPNGFVEYVGLPLAGSANPYADPAVRQAMSRAIDRVALSKAAYGGGALPASGFVPPTAGPAYAPGACGPSTGADLPSLRATVAAATLGKPLLTLSFPDVDANARVARELQRQWQTGLGLRVQLDPLSPNAFLQKATSAAGFAGAFLEGWQGLSPSADDTLGPLLSSAGTGTSNLAHFVSPPFERALTDARQAEDDKGRQLAYRNLEQRACESLPLIPLVFRQWHYLVRTSRLSSSNPSWTDRATGLLDLRDVWLR
ncbi:MAG: hypothetical protein JWM40_2855 [Frankiales bacterium]|nr:hypothetical protein [Frankiales bacterium]